MIEEKQMQEQTVNNSLSTIQLATNERIIRKYAIQDGENTHVTFYITDMRVIESKESIYSDSQCSQLKQCNIDNVKSVSSGTGYVSKSKPKGALVVLFLASIIMLILSFAVFEDIDETLFIITLIVSLIGLLIFAIMLFTNAAKIYSAWLTIDMVSSEHYLTYGLFNNLNLAGNDAITIQTNLDVLKIMASELPVIIIDIQKNGGDFAYSKWVNNGENDTTETPAGDIFKNF